MGFLGKDGVVLAVICLVLANNIHQIFGAATADFICSLPRERGGCHKNDIVFGYDSASRSCRLFNYSGCDGNANRFKDALVCLGVCKSKYIPVPEKPYEPQEEIKCLLPAHQGDCRYNYTLHYFHPESQTCKPFQYTGCGGNLNQFFTNEDCLRTCKPNTANETSTTTTAATDPPITASEAPVTTTTPAATDPPTTGVNERRNHINLDNALGRHIFLKFEFTGKK